MKKLFGTWTLFLLMAIFLAGCDLSDNIPVPSPEEQLQDNFPQVQFVLSTWAGSDMTRYQLIWMQQLGAIRGSHLQVDRYKMESTILDGHWQYFYHNIYLGCQTLISQADEAKAPAYRGIARVMQAYGLGLMTDTWGDIPFNNAFNYFGGPAPVYDQQSEIYQKIFELLLSAIDDLNVAMADDSFRPAAAEDLIYQADLDKWKRAARVLQMRFMLRQANLTNDYENITVLAESGMVFRGNQDNMAYPFTLSFPNPHFSNDNDANKRNTRMGKYLVDKLIETNDPRLPVFVRKNIAQQYLGTPPGEQVSSASFVGTTLASANSPLFLLTYAEQKFIEAEIYYHAQQQSLADQAFSEAVKASLANHNVSNPQWESLHADIQNVSLEQIINAKYIALFLQAEVWSDYRRTGFPQLTPYAEAETPEIPRRFVYPHTEAMQNPNVPAEVNIYTRMWWDATEEPVR